LGPSIDFSASTAEGPNPLAAQSTPVCDEPIGSYARTFGDGETSDDPLPVRVYRAAGTYTVSLTAGLTGDAGVHEAEDALITVRPPMMKGKPAYIYRIDWHMDRAGTAGGEGVGDREAVGTEDG